MSIILNSMNDSPLQGNQMNLAIKLYENVDISDKPEAIPGIWPAEVIELGNSISLPEGPWALMEKSEYEEYVRYHKPLFDAWYNEHIPKDREYVDP